MVHVLSIAKYSIIKLLENKHNSFSVGNKVTYISVSDFGAGNHRSEGLPHHSTLNVNVSALKITFMIFLSA